MRIIIFLWLLIQTITFALGCKKTSSAQAACFHVTSKANSKSTNSIFAKRRCQGGGVTWAGLLYTTIGQHGNISGKYVPGETGWVSFFDGDLGHAEFSIDEEGDAVRFCSDNEKLLEMIRKDVAHMNANAAKLESVMNATPALEIECTEADGSIPKMP